MRANKRNLGTREQVTRGGSVLLVALSIGLLALGGPGPAGAAGDKQQVEIVNTPAKPVPVQEVQTRVPVFFTAHAHTLPGEHYVESPEVFTVPNGKLLVIESVSVQVRMFGEDGLASLEMFFSHTNPDELGNAYGHILAVEEATVAEPNGELVTTLMGTHDVSALVPAGSQVRFRMSRMIGDASPPMSFFRMSGYLIPA